MSRDATEAADPGTGTVHAFGVNDNFAESYCGVVVMPAPVYYREATPVPLDRNLDEVECGSCRDMLNL